MELITLGAGCFWCIEAVFQKLKGVEEVLPGYMGGQTINPTYREICGGNTGHAEVARIEFNSEIISLTEILKVFFSTHDPTTLNRQGNDVGTQYRSVIFFESEEQKKLAVEMKEELNNSGIFDSSIVTEISPASKFYPAEDYHVNYYNNNSYQPYCQIIINPKLRKLKKLFPEKLK